MTNQPRQCRAVQENPWRGRGTVAPSYLRPARAAVAGVWQMPQRIHSDCAAPGTSRTAARRRGAVLRLRRYQSALDRVPERSAGWWRGPRDADSGLSLLRAAAPGGLNGGFTTAVMMLKGNVTLRDYTDEGLRDPAVLAMADRVSYRARVASDGPATELAASRCRPWRSGRRMAGRCRTPLTASRAIPAIPWTGPFSKPSFAIARRFPLNPFHRRMWSGRSRWCETWRTWPMSPRSCDCLFKGGFRSA